MRTRLLWSTLGCLAGIGCGLTGLAPASDAAGPDPGGPDARVGTDAAESFPDASRDDAGPDVSAPAFDARPPGSGGGELEIEIGVPDDATGLEFTPLAPGSDLEFSGGGQAGLAVSLAVRCLGAGDAAHISATVTHLENGTTAMRHERTLPDALACGEEGWCTLLPVRIGVGMLGEPGEVDGAEAAVDATVRAVDGRSAHAMTNVVLRRR